MQKDKRMDLHKLDWSQNYMYLNMWRWNIGWEIKEFFYWM